MKKAISILLVLLLALALLPMGALAADVVLSPQNLRVDGKRVECEKYNIDGSNYFKLRDIAMVLSDTGSQFSVSWDGEKKCISLVSGEEYEPNGSELDLSGGDKSASAVPGTATLLVNGVERSDLSAYNLDGNNFFKLRDLGDALGFKVDYDKATNTAIIVSRAWSWPVKWLTEEYIYNVNGAATSHSVYTYDENGHTLTSLWEDEYGTEDSASVYDELGRLVKYTRNYVNGYGDEIWEEHGVTTYEFDKWGQQVRSLYEAAGDVSSETLYTYDEDGRLLSEETVSNAGRSCHYYTYDENGYEIKYVSTYDDEVMSTTEYTRDEAGRILRERRTTEGENDSFYDYTYDEKGNLVESVYTYGDYRSVTRHAYDEKGKEIRTETESDVGSSVSTYIYDENGNLVQEENEYGDYISVYVLTYDERGLVTKQEYSSNQGGSYTTEYTYNEDGDTLTEISRREGVTNTTTYTYDPETRTKNVLCLTEYEGVG